MATASACAWLAVTQGSDVRSDARNAAERRAYTARPVVKRPKPDLSRLEFSYLNRFAKSNDDRSEARDVAVNAIRAQYQQFPADILDDVEDFARCFASQFADVLPYYDVIQGYATDRIHSRT